jgi:hypothetical protein
LRGALFGGAGGSATRAILLNLSALPVLVRPPATLVRARFDQWWAPPATLVWGAGALRKAQGQAPDAGVVLPGYSITVLSH